jgi:hypothetical protein
VAEEAAAARVYETVRGVGMIEVRRGSKGFHRQAKRIKLHGARVIGGEPADKNETLNKVRS